MADRTSSASASLIARSAVSSTYTGSLRSASETSPRASPEPDARAGDEIAKSTVIDAAAARARFTASTVPSRRFDDTRPPFASIDIYGQLVLDDGSLVGTLDNVNLVVSNNNFNQRFPRASFDPVTKRFLAVWQDYRNGGLPDVYGQFLDNTGATILTGSTVNLPVSTNVDDQDPPVIVHSGPAGAYLTVWHDDRDMSAFSIYGQILLDDGTLFGSTAPNNLPLVPAADNAVTFVYPPGIAAVPVLSRNCP